MAGNGLALWQGARRQKGRGTESVGRLPQSAPPPPGRPADWHGPGLLLGALSPFLGVLYHQESLQAVLGPVYFGRQRSGNSCCGPVRFEHRLVNGLLECVAMTMPHLGVASGLSAGLGCNVLYMCTFHNNKMSDRARRHARRVFKMSPTRCFDKSTRHLES